MKSLLKMGLLLALSFTQVEAATVAEITQFTDSGESFIVHVATDNKDNFIAAYDDENFVYGVFSEGGTEWSSEVLLSNPLTNAKDSNVAMDQTSTGLAIWTEFDMVNETIRTSFFNNGLWTPIATPLENTTDSLNTPDIAMDGTGKAVAIWVNSTLLEIHSSFFSGGAWSPFQIIGTGNNGTEVAYSPSGRVVASWSHFDLGINNIWANIFNGTSWVGPTLLDNAGNSFPDNGIDAAGNAFVIWRADSDTNTKVSRFNGTAWSAPVILSFTSDTPDPHIAVALDGTAIAVWIDTGNLIKMSQFDGITWSPAVTIANGVEVNITMDDRGDALITYVTTLNQLFTALLPKGGTLQSAVFVTSDTLPILNVDPALSSQSVLASLVWNDGGGSFEFSDSYGTFVAFGPTPPSDIFGATCSAAGDRVNIISFTPSTDPTVVAYEISRNGVLIALIPASGPFIFYDHGRCRGVSNTYSVVSVNAEDIRSGPITITLN